MIIANFVTNRAMMGQTSTYEDFWKTLGEFIAQLKLCENGEPLHKCNN